MTSTETSETSSTLTYSEEAEKIEVFVKEERFGACRHAGCEDHGGDPCVFPFRYKGETYYQCTDVDDYDYWCSTCVDIDGHFLQDKAEFGTKISSSLC